ncbi:MAG: aldo/keto reductase [Planctomycetota bacterium]|jgi:L-glyceraldehyde 3-phosphate reductase
MSPEFTEDRYEKTSYRRCGRSGLKLPAISLGCWHNFGDSDDQDVARQMLRGAFELGITHFDLANCYGLPPGSAELNVGRILRSDFGEHRDELIISTKAAQPMWPGPYGEWGSRKHMLASLDQSLQRLGLDYVDIFYSHRPDPETPLEETLGALQTAVHQGKALYAGISNYKADATRQAHRILDALGVPLTIHQPSYSMLNRSIEQELLPAAGELGVGVIVFCPLAQGVLSSRYLDGIPPDSRVAKPTGWLQEEHLTEESLDKARALNELAAERGQTLAQMALAWILRDERITSALIGASRLSQIEENVGALQNADFSAEELSKIDQLLS